MRGAWNHDKKIVPDGEIYGGVLNIIHCKTNVCVHVCSSPFTFENSQMEYSWESRRVGKFLVIKVVFRENLRDSFHVSCAYVGVLKSLSLRTTGNVYEKLSAKSTTSCIKMLYLTRAQCAVCSSDTTTIFLICTSKKISRSCLLNSLIYLIYDRSVLKILIKIF